MAELRTRLVIDGDQAGAKKALEDTATGINKVQEAAGKAAQPVKDVAEGLKTATTEASTAATEIPKVGVAVEGVGTKFSGLKTAAIGAIGGIAGALAGAALGALVETASGAFTAYVNNIISSGPQVKAALDEHAALVKSIKGFWSDNVDAASRYGAVSGPLLAFKAQQDILTQQDALKRLQDDALTGGALNPAFTVLPGLSNFGVNDPQVGRGSNTTTGAAGTAFEGTVAKFREELQAGTADAIAFQKEVSLIAASLPADDVEGRSLAKDLLGDTDDMVKVQTQLQQARDLYAGLMGDAGAAATALGKSAGEFVASGNSAGAALPNLEAYATLLARIAATPKPGASYSSADLPAALPGPPVVIGGGFAAGGFTGHRPADQVAGVVHGQEYVFDAASTARIGVNNLEAIRRGVAGYASGGYVGARGAGGSGGVRASDFSVVDELIADLSGVSKAVIDFGKQLWNTRNPLEALGSVIQSVSQNFLNSALGAISGAAGNALSGLIDGAISGAFGGGTVTAGVHHQGGVVGRATQFRNVPAALFANAPRFHQGLASDEFAAILQDGETVLPKGTRMGGGHTTVNNWNIETPSPRAFMESRASVARAGARLNGQAWRHT